MKEIKLKNLNETIYTDTLDNGLKIYMWKREDANSFNSTLSVKYGSIYKSFTIGKKKYEVPNGLAHFLEHIKFNESKDMTAISYYQKNGCDTNAFTTFNYTNYQVYGNNDPITNTIHLIDFVLNDYFTREIVQNEKGIIVEEAKMGEDDPYTVMLFKHLDNMFHKSEYKTLITGNPNDIKSITLKDVRLVYDTFYHPKNMFLVITGNFNPYEMIEKIKESESKKEYLKYKNPKRIIDKEDKSVRVPYEELNINVSNTKIKIGIKIPKTSLKDFDDLHIKILLQILLKANFGNTSVFKNELLEKGLITNLSYMREIFDDYIVILFTIDSEYKNEIIKLFNEKLNNLTIDEDTFDRMKKANIASLILEFEDVELVNSIIQSEILNYGDIIYNIKDVHEKISYKDILKFIKQLKVKERSILILNPLNEKRD